MCTDQTLNLGAFRELEMDHGWNAQRVSVRLPAMYSIGDMRDGDRDIAGEWYGC
jgi:hypothetical protein